jgi:hypothetical protein
MASSGYVYPTTGWNDTSSGTAAWANPINAISNNASNATFFAGFTFGELGARLLVNNAVSGQLKTIALTTTVTAVIYGSPTDKWGCALTAESINSTGFGLTYQASGAAGTSQRLVTSRYDFAIPAGSTIDGIEAIVERGANATFPYTVSTDYMALKVYYTEGGGGGDATAPVLSITIPTTAATYSTAVSSLTLSGTATDAVGVTGVSWQGPSVSGTAITGGTSTNATWAVTGIALSAGSNYFSVKAYDATGNMGSGAITVSYDATLPTVTIGFPTSSSTFSTSSSTITLTGTASDNIGVTGVNWVTASSGGPLTGTTSWSAVGLALSPGSNVISIRAYDAAGNMGSGTITVTYSTPDVQSPVLTITSPTTGLTFATTASSFTLSGTATDSSGVTGVSWQGPAASGVAVTGGVLTNATWTATGLALSAGSNYFSVKAFDVSGNMGSGALTVTRDNTLPTITIGYPTTAATYATNANTITITGTAADNIGVTGITWAGTGTATALSGTTSWSVTNIPLVTGSNIITMRAYDAAGNMGSGAITVTYTAPTGQTSTALTYATSAWNDPTAGATAWATPGNALTDDASYATFMNGGSYGEVGARLVLNNAASGSLKIQTLTAGVTALTYGSSGDLWGCQLSASGINASGFGISYQASGAAGVSQRLVTSVYGFTIPDGSIIDGVEAVIERGIVGAFAPYYTYVDFMAIKVYYTEVGGEGPTGDVTAPLITITDPTTATTWATSANTVTLSGTATDAIGVTGITWQGPSVSGTAVTGGTLTNATWTVTGVALATGSNYFSVKAYDASGNMGSGALTITYTAPSGDTTIITTPWLFPNEALSIPSGVLYDWISPYSILVDDDLCAQCSTPGPLPTTSEEIGTRLLIGGVPSGDTHAVALGTHTYYEWSPWENPHHSDPVTYGSSGDVWGCSLTPATLNASGFGLSYQLGSKYLGVTQEYSEPLAGYDYRFNINPSATILGIEAKVARGLFYTDYAPDDVLFVDYLALRATYYTDTPVVTITSPTTAPTYATTGATLSLSGTAVDNVCVTGMTWTSPTTGGIIVGASGASISWSVTGIALATGSSTLTVKAYDASGNMGSGAIVVTYTLPDTGLPTVSIIYPTTGSAFHVSGSLSDFNHSGLATLTGTATDNIGVTKVTWSNTTSAGYGSISRFVTGQLWASSTTTGRCLCVTGTNATWSVSGIPVSGGPNLITITAWDAADNIRSVTVTAYPCTQRAYINYPTLGTGVGYFTPLVTKVASSSLWYNAISGPPILSNKWTNSTTNVSGEASTGTYIPFYFDYVVGTSTAVPLVTGRNVINYETYTAEGLLTDQESGGSVSCSAVVDYFPNAPDVTVTYPKVQQPRYDLPSVHYNGSYYFSITNSPSATISGTTNSSIAITGMTWWNQHNSVTGVVDFTPGISPTWAITGVPIDYDIKNPIVITAHDASGNYNYGYCVISYEPTGTILTSTTTPWKYPSGVTVSTTGVGWLDWTGDKNTVKSDDATYINGFVGAAPQEYPRLWIDSAATGSILTVSPYVTAWAESGVAGASGGITSGTWGLSSIAVSSINSSNFGVQLSIGGFGGALYGLRLSNFGFDVPTDQVISGVEVKVNRYYAYVIVPAYDGTYYLDSVAMRVTYGPAKYNLQGNIHKVVASTTHVSGALVTIAYEDTDSAFASGLSEATSGRWTATDIYKSSRTQEVIATKSGYVTEIFPDQPQDSYYNSQVPDTEWENYYHNQDYLSNFNFNMLETSDLPTVTITSPSTTAYTNAVPTQNLVGTASSPNLTITSVTWQVGTVSGTCEGTTSWTASGVPLILGEQTIQIRVYDNYGYWNYDTLNAIYDPDYSAYIFTPLWYHSTLEAI